MKDEPAVDLLAATALHDSGKASGSGEPATRRQGSTKSAPAAESPPTRIGRYRILERLGEGAMGAVWLAEDTELKRKVAIKIPKLGEFAHGDARARFLREARSAAALRHPNICPVYDIGDYDGRPFIAMAYVQGRPLAHFIRPDSLVAPRSAARVIRKLALALQEAHANGVVHRDLKPANVMIDAKGEPIVMDFGLSCPTGESDADGPRLTMHGYILGTPAYMSPEQVEGAGAEIGPASDIYSLGVIFFELVTCSRPFHGGLGTLFAKIISEPPPRPTTLREDLDPQLETICLKMLAKQPAERYPSMAAVAEALTDFLRTKAADSSPESAAEGDARRLPPPLPPPLSPQTEAMGAAGTLAPGTDAALSTDAIANSAVATGVNAGIATGIAPRIITGINVSPAPRLPLAKSAVLPKRNPQSVAALIASLQSRGLTPVIGALAAAIVVLAGALAVVLSLPKEDKEQTKKNAADSRTASEAISGDRQTTGDVSGAAANAQGPQGQWIELFDGRSLAGWTTISGRPCDWVVRPNVIETRPGAGSIMTVTKFPLDFELHVEFWLPDKPNSTGQAKANSGILLLGRHEIQILDMYQNPGVRPVQASGALYDLIAPVSTTPKPPGTWQSFDITFHSPRRENTLLLAGRLTLVHDGVKVIDDAPVPFTPSPLAQNQMIGEPGPLALQDHGAAVCFRNLRWRPIERVSLTTTSSSGFQPSSSPTAKPPSDAVTFAGHKYKFFRQQMTWKEAKVVCTALGGHLVIINFKGEDDFVARLIGDAGAVDSWLGITDEAQEGAWRSVDGEKLYYTHWATDQPNNKNGEEHFGLISNRKFPGSAPLGWTWCDQPNRSTVHQPGYVCEWE